MGNFGSYFRPSPGDVVVAQPAPVHLDDVNVFGVGKCAFYRFFIVHLFRQPSSSEMNLSNTVKD